MWDLTALLFREWVAAEKSEMNDLFTTARRRLRLVVYRRAISLFAAGTSGGGRAPGRVGVGWLRGGMGNCCYGDRFGSVGSPLSNNVEDPPRAHPLDSRGREATLG